MSKTNKPKTEPKAKKKAETKDMISFIMAPEVAAPMHELIEDSEAALGDKRTRDAITKKEVCNTALEIFFALDRDTQLRLILENRQRLLTTMMSSGSGGSAMTDLIAKLKD